jgi:multicomponent Na+:H+ antiporter subunit E
MKWIGKLIGLVRFLLFYAKEVVLANLRVAYDVLTPRDRANPAIIAFPLAAKTDFEILVVANLISMTPGTLSMDVSTDRKTLYIHAMFVDDVEALKEELKVNFEGRVLALLRAS